MEVSSPDVMPQAVFEASGHLDGFDDMIVECAECGQSHRADHLVEDATDLEDAESREPTAVAKLLGEHDVSCPACGVSLAGEPVEEFNLMFETNIGPGSSDPGYLRPETAQGIFVEFPQLVEYARNQLPFGVAQIGSAYRNEISPRKALVRVREFTQAELELFVDPETDKPDLERVADRSLPLYSAAAQGAEDGDVERLTVETALEETVIGDPWIAYYLGLSRDWFERIGVDMDRFRFRQHRPGELAHYAADCWDAETEVGGDWIEVTGFANRGDYDLRKHADHSGESFTVFQQYDEPITVERATVDPDMSVLGPEYGEAAGNVATALEELVERDPDAFREAPETITVEVDGEAVDVPLEVAGFGLETVTEAGEQISPHVIEPSFGVGRLVYSVLAHALDTDEVDGESRTVLRLPPEIAPTTVGVFPLMDKDGLAERARDVASDLRTAGLDVTYDAAGAIGRRYRRQDEIGTPYCVTVDYDTLEDDTVTVRDRDTTEQRRVEIDKLPATVAGLAAGEVAFAEV